MTLLASDIMYRIMQAFSWMLIHSVWQALLLAGITGICLTLKWKNAQARYTFILLQLALFTILCIFTFCWTYNQVGEEAGTTTSVYTAFIKTGIDRFSFLSPLIMICWACFFVLRSVKNINGMIYLHQCRQQVVYTPPEYWVKKIQALSCQLQIKKTILLLESGATRIPQVIGHFKPVILVPLGLLSGLPAAQVEAVLLHELAHIRRNDYFVNLLQVIMESLFFFNPGILWLSALLREERENCCDDIALAQTNDHTEYVQALISFKEFSLYGNAQAIAFPGKKDQLFNRASRILGLPRQPTKRNFLLPGIFILSALLLLVIINWTNIFTSTAMFASPVAALNVTAGVPGSKNILSLSIPEMDNVVKAAQRQKNNALAGVNTSTRAPKPDEKNNVATASPAANRNSTAQNINSLLYEKEDPVPAYEYLQENEKYRAVTELYQQMEKDNVRMKKEDEQMEKDDLGMKMEYKPLPLTDELQKTISNAQRSINNASVKIRDAQTILKKREKTLNNRQTILKEREKILNNRAIAH